MTIQELNDWGFEFDPPLVDTSEIWCEACEEWSSHTEWYETETGCEDCGSHEAIGCPQCGRGFDRIWPRTFQTRAFRGS